jgi:hypothetical protein
MSADTEYLKITPCKYLKGKASPSGEPIALFMPAGLTFSNEQQWQNANWTGIGAKLRDSISDLIGGDINNINKADLKSRFEEEGRKLGEFAGSNVGPYAIQFGAGVGAGFLSTIAGSALGITTNLNAQAITGSVAGVVLNPQTEIYYNAPGMRQWGLNYVFTPKNRSDQTNMQRIIKELKKYSTPAKTENEWLEIPYVFKVEFMRGGGVNKNLPLTKPAALVNVSSAINPGLDYWASFDDGAPVSVGLSMSFAEIGLIMRDDHDEGNMGY